MATPNRDALVHELDEQRKHLEQEREKVTEAALNLGREKAALEVSDIDISCDDTHPVVGGAIAIPRGKTSSNGSDNAG
jgi:hypothetical protein